MNYTKEQKKKIIDKILELLNESFKIDNIVEKRENPAWVIVCHILQKHNIQIKADMVLPMRPGHFLGPYMKWLPDDLQEFKDVIDE